MSDYADRWFDFVEEYNQQSSVPLSYVLLPNPQTTGFRTMGSPIGMTKLTKSEWRKIVDNNAPVRNLDRGLQQLEGRRMNQDKLKILKRICDLRNFNHLDRENKLEEDINNLYKQFRFCFAYTCIVNLILIGVMIRLILTN